jgi:hypothetical protein
MFSESVAQKPTMPVNAGKKKCQNSVLFANFAGSSKIGPSPLLALMAHINNAIAATGRNIALNTNNFFMLSTPRYTTHILMSQKIKKQMPVLFVRTK